MKQKLMAVAVAGAFAVPGAALAQVTISGKFGVTLSSNKISNVSAARAAGVNTSSLGLHDNTSIIQFAAQENLGGGLTAIGQYQLRPLLDGNAPVANAVNTGSTTPINFVGLRSTSWGQLRAGTLSTWGNVGTGFSPNASGQFSSSGLMNYVMIGGAPLSFASSRLGNMIEYTSPKMGGFHVIGAYSTAPKGQDSDHLFAQRKGSAWYLMPEFNAAGWKIGWAHANHKFENTASATGSLDLKADKLYVETNLAGIDIGVTWAKIKAKHGVGFGAVAAGTSLVDVRKWLIPLRYRTGNHTFAMHYGKSNDDRIQAGDQSHKYQALAYAYSFSRRTNMALTWAKMNNAAASAADLSSATGASGYGAAGFSALAGEDQSVIQVSLNHSF